MRRTRPEAAADAGRFARRRRVGLLAAGLAVLVFAAGEAAAGVGVGLEFGLAQATDRNREMRQYGAVAALDLPLRQPLGTHWLFWTQVAGRAGVMTGWGDEGSYAALGLRANLTAVDAGVSLEAAASPMTISRPHFGGANFGGNVQMLAQIGFSYQITRTLSFGYRFQHMSNGGLKPSNPGLDSHLFRLETRWGSLR